MQAYNICDKLDAAAGKYETCRLAIRDSLLARVEVVSCPATVVFLLRYDEHQRHGLSRYLRAPLRDRTYRLSRPGRRPDSRPVLRPNIYLIAVSTGY